MTPRDPTTPASPSPEKRSRVLTPSRIVFGLIVLAAASFGLYELGTATGKHVTHTGACAQSLNLAAAADPLVHGEVAALSLASTANPLGRIDFDDATGARTSIASFAGKTVLLNLWATWCVPCRTEMPSLDKLQGQLGSDRFVVVPVNIDTVRLEKAHAFLKEIGANNLSYFADNTADILQSLKQTEKIVGLPTTILIGRDGCEIGTMAGPAQWDSPDAKALIEKLDAAPTPDRQT